MSDICMCIERLWPYWLLHWRTQYYGLLTIIALYIGYLITFGCYLKAKWFIVYLWKGTTTKCLVNVFMGKLRKGWSEGESLRKSVCAVAWQDEVEKLVFCGNEGFYWQDHSENELLQWHSYECNPVGVLSFILFPPRLITVFCVNSCTQLYTSFCSLHHYTLAYLLFTVYLIFCTSPILVLSCSSIFAQLLYSFHTK